MDLFIPPLHPGPIDSSVLHLQSNHRSGSVWNDQHFNPIINLSKYNRGIYVDVVQDERVCGYLKKADFYGVANLGKIVLDHSLIIALVERWRPEVHAFHLPFGEVRITLQDVEVLLGLRVDGKPVTSPVQRSKDEWYNRLETLLGIQPKLKVLTECKIGASGLPSEITLKPDNPILEVQVATRLLILHIFGGLLFADTTQSKIPLYLLNLLEDFDSAGEYSWGSAVLTYLYRALCGGVHFQSSTMGGCLVLLQLWAWERLPLVRPGKGGYIRLLLIQEQVIRQADNLLWSSWTKERATAVDGPSMAYLALTCLPRANTKGRLWLNMCHKCSLYKII